MGNVFKAIKVDVLSVIAFPMLLLATLAKMIAKGLEKTIVLIKITCIALGVIVFFETARKFSESLDIVLLIVLFVIVMAAFTALLFLLMTAISVVTNAIITVLINILDAIYSRVYALFAKLFNICKNDYDSLRDEMSLVVRNLSCIFYKMLWALNGFIVLFAKNAFVIMLLASIGLVLGGAGVLNLLAQRDYGVNIITFVELFPTFEIIYGIALFLTVTLGISGVFVALGVEWSEWGDEMKDVMDNYGEAAAE